MLCEGGAPFDHATFQWGFSLAHSHGEADQTIEDAFVRVRRSGQASVKPTIILLSE